MRDTPHAVSAPGGTGSLVGDVRAVVVYVSDETRALDFYVGKLGFEHLGDALAGAGVCGIAVAPTGAGASLVLVHPSLSEMGAGLASRAREHIGETTGIVFATADLEETHAVLSARGVEFSQPPAVAADGCKTARLRDPDGNEFVLVEASPR